MAEEIPSRINPLPNLKQAHLAYFFLTLFFFSTKCFSQTAEKIKFKKDGSLIYFFQKGEKTDTLSRLSDHFFYLVVPDTLKKDISIEVENGQLLRTSNDSIVKLNYLPGFKYESFYEPEENVTGKKKKIRYEYKTGVDGTSVYPHGKISISLINKRTGGLILENNFVYLK